MSERINLASVAELFSYFREAIVKDLPRLLFYKIYLFENLRVTKFHFLREFNFSLFLWNFTFEQHAPPFPRIIFCVWTEPTV